MPTTRTEIENRLEHLDHRLPLTKRKRLADAILYGLGVERGNETLPMENLDITLGRGLTIYHARVVGDYQGDDAIPVHTIRFDAAFAGADSVILAYQQQGKTVSHTLLTYHEDGSRTVTHA